MTHWILAGVSERSRHLLCGGFHDRRTAATLNDKEQQRSATTGPLRSRQV